MLRLGHCVLTVQSINDKWFGLNSYQASAGSALSASGVRSWLSRPLIMCLCIQLDFSVDSKTGLIPLSWWRYSWYGSSYTGHEVLCLAKGVECGIAGPRDVSETVFYVSCNYVHNKHSLAFRTACCHHANLGLQKNSHSRRKLHRGNWKTERKVELSIRHCSGKKKTFLTSQSWGCSVVSFAIAYSGSYHRRYRHVYFHPKHIRSWVVMATYASYAMHRHLKISSFCPAVYAWKVRWKVINFLARGFSGFDSFDFSDNLRASVYTTRVKISCHGLIVLIYPQHLPATCGAVKASDQPFYICEIPLSNVQEIR